MIKNKKSLVENIPEGEGEKRRMFLYIIEKVLEKIRPYNLVMNEIKKTNIGKYDRVFVIGAGKGCCSMAEAVYEYLDDRISDGFIIIPEGEKKPVNEKIQYTFASHPLPNKNGLEGAKKILKITKGAKSNDLVISLISGGGSALMPLPADDISLEAKVETTSLLLKSGANINEVNAVRKHLSQIKGGFLAKATYPAKTINLVISDVLGDDLSVIASGPFSPDNSTFNDAVSVLKKYNLWTQIPADVRKFLEKSEIETPKPGSEIFKNVKSVILANHKTAAEESVQIAEKMGIECFILDSNLHGECKKQAHNILKKINDRDVLYILAGETTVNVKGDGCGGRNQEFVLAFLKEITKNPKNWRNFVVASVGTDGVDGFCPEKIAGAIASKQTLKRAEDKKLSIEKYLNNNDSYNFFNKTDGLIKTGPTGTNLGDIILIVKND